MREPTEMELRVAEGIYNSARKQYATKAPDWAEADKKTRDAILADARAAIRAMREPTDDMLAACLNVPILGPHARARDYDRAHYHVMIDAASPPDSGDGQ